MKDTLAGAARSAPDGAVEGRDPRGPILAVVGIVVAEVVVAFVDPVAGAALHGLLLLGLLLGWVAAGDRALLVLALVPLGRVTSLALTPRDDGAWAHLLTGLPLLIAVLWLLRGSARPVVWARPAWHALAVALAGVPLGLIASALLDLPRAGGMVVPLAALVVFVFAGVLEELLFRGLVQRGLTRPLGARGVVLADVLFVAAYLPTRDVGLIVWMAVLGLGAGYYVRRTGGLTAVAVAHGLMAAGALVIWPALG
ncbi:MAG: amino terminal protease family protein [Modestobacter sp.]|nr:amino terminal protease family protein [Modestobacter sp.]